MRSRASGLLLAVVLAGASGAHAELVDRIVAIVDRDVVTLSEVEQAQAIARIRSDEASTMVEIVERLIERRLIEREVERFSVEPVSPELVSDAVGRLRAGFPSRDAFQRTLARNGLAEEALRSQLERQLQVTRYLERRFRALTYVTDEEVRRYYREELVAELAPLEPPELVEVFDSIRRILEERKFNERVEQWIDDLKTRARIRRYVW